VAADRNVRLKVPAAFTNPLGKTPVVEGMVRSRAPVFFLWIDVPVRTHSCSGV